MKKLMILPFIFASSLAFAQTNAEEFLDAQTKLQVTNNYIKAELKTLKYQVSIKQDNKNIFKSTFEVKNGKEFTLLSKEIGKQYKDVIQKNAVFNQQEVSLSIEGQEKEAGNVEQIKVIVNIGKDNNIFSEFSWQVVNMETAKKISMLAKGDKGAVNETIPIIANNKSTILVSHQKNNETFFILDDKEFTIKAIY